MSPSEDVVCMNVTRSYPVLIINGKSCDCSLHVAINCTLNSLVASRHWLTATSNDFVGEYSSHCS